MAKSQKGSRLRSFREGDLAEGLGVQLLRPMCAVAPVPREEDVGLDAVATLLLERKARGGVYLDPDLSFGVQFKSASISDFEVNGAAWRWISNLRIPYFVATVDLEASRVALYPPFELYRHLAFERHAPASSGRLLLESVNPDPLDVTGVVLGPPCATWTATEVASTKTRPACASHLHACVEAATSALDALRWGQFAEYSWSKTMPPEPKGPTRPVASTGRSALTSLLRELVVPVRSLMGHAFVRGDDRLMQASLDLARAMKRRRVDPGLKEYVDKVRKLVGESVRDGMHSSLKNVR